MTLDVHSHAIAKVATVEAVAIVGATAGTSSGFVTIAVAFIDAGGTVAVAWLARRVNQVHVLVNSQMTAALDRVAALETKMGLTPGEAIPGAQVVTQQSAPDAEPVELPPSPKVPPV